MALNGFTPTQKKILALLDDGMGYTPDQIKGPLCLNDPHMELATIKTHLSLLRKRLSVHGKDIMCRGGYYQIVRFTRKD